ncbi:MAG: nicotinate-nucleotide--dimethylbenzimidazole phosphoribosyltransferase [Candidatus Omnitrophota bacterium]|nr:MAG: nicotinate-nucleotide--dimethylbenzimidazole phosphoribosyltransferase [Candidatus Omnitrophota bacterium]
MDRIKETIDRITDIDSSLMEKAQQHLDNLTKPQGSLGKLEDLAKLVVSITQKEAPSLKNKVIFTLAADHGVAAEGVSAFPQGVTAQMVYNFINEGAAINVLAKHVGAKVVVADVGVAEELKMQTAKLKIKKIGYGTKNIIAEPAMSREEGIKSIEAGIELFEEEYANNGIDIVGTGEMGIANTTASSAICAVITGAPVEDVTGRGTGIDEAALSNKIKVIKKALGLRQPDSKDALDVLSKVGGFEIGGVAGIILAAASKKVPVVIDGFISAAAALIAYTLAPKVKKYMIAAHCSVEKGHRIILKHMGIEPLLDLNLRLGEGTGAALAMNIIEAGVKILNEMATFKDAGVSEKEGVATGLL